MSYPYQIKSLEQYHEDYQKSIEDPENFWQDIAENFVWKKKWDKVLEWNFVEPKVQWFINGKLNITENCLDRHLEKLGDKPAIIWEPNNPEERTRIVTYSRLHKRVCQFAQVLKNNGVKKGDRVCIYMGMVPELAYAVLGCARIGAIHSVIFGGFSAQSIADRLYDAQSEFIVTCDGAYRGAKDIPLKSIIDDALIGNRTIKKVIVYTRTRTPISMLKGRDVWWEDEMEFAESQIEKDNVVTMPAAEMDAEDPLFILYTSGSTGKPKGVVHSSAGYMVWTNYTFVNVFQYTPGDIFFCTADVGWITGHSYILYGPLSAGATSVMFEGIPTWPNAGRFWDIVDKYKVNTIYTAPTAIRSLMSYGLEPLKGKDLSSLKVLGTVGEPINEEAWHWYDENIGKGKCPIVDTWWQTETGGILISNLAGITPSKPGWATLPLPGVKPLLVDEKGKEVTEKDEDGLLKGNLCMEAPWPAILRTTYGDHERCRTNYFASYENLYFTGDGAQKNKDGYYRITGRVDDVLNVSGHRIGTAEVENAINMHAGVIESAVVGYPHDIKGQGIYAFVIYSHIHVDEEQTRKDIFQTVSRVIGPIAKPDKIQFVSGLPKTRSGKIMRRILRKIAEGESQNIGDTTTLLDPAVVDEIIQKENIDSGFTRFMKHPKQTAIADYTYDLPGEKIAYYPLPERDQSKLLIWQNEDIKEDIYRNIADYLPKESLLIFNDTKVIQARILFNKASGAKIELFCLEPFEENPEPALIMHRTLSVKWKCMIGGASKWKTGSLIKTIYIDETEIKLTAELKQKLPDAYVTEFSWSPSHFTFAQVINEAGETPLPPYIKRKSIQEDKERYQTIYALKDGSVAAPTAGLHFTPYIFDRLKIKNIDTGFVSLHVSAGTFRPVKAEFLAGHEMHSEWMEVSVSAIENILKNLDKNIVAVGTTSLRTLESIYWMGVKAFLEPGGDDDYLSIRQWEVYDDHLAAPSVEPKLALKSLLNRITSSNRQTLFIKTQIIIVPGYKFKIVKALVTNFHQPNSTLLLLVAAIAGDRWKEIYEYALQK